MDMLKRGKRNPSNVCSQYNDSFPLSIDNNVQIRTRRKTHFWVKGELKVPSNPLVMWSAEVYTMLPTIQCKEKGECVHLTDDIWWRQPQSKGIWQLSENFKDDFGHAPPFFPPVQSFEQHIRANQADKTDVYWQHYSQHSGTMIMITSGWRLYLLWWNITSNNI